MARGKITKRTVDALLASRTEGFLWDEGIKGFGARRTKGGGVLQFRMGGREANTRRYTIGSHGSPWTPTTAREEAQRLLVLIAQGINPVELEGSVAGRRSILRSATTPTASRSHASAKVGRFWSHGRSGFI